MTKEEIIEMIKDELNIKVYSEEHDVPMRIQLRWDDEVICEDFLC